MAGTNRLLIQVVARMKPQRDGVSDPALLLAAELKAVYGIDTAFVVLNSNESGSVPFPVVCCAPSQLLESCSKLAENGRGAVLVHLVGYGYSSHDGAPVLLARSLADLRESGRFHIAVYFYELFVSRKPWESGRSCLYAGRQRRAVRAIVRQCHLLLTNIREQAKWLEHENRTASPVRLIPVISTIGEVLEPTPIAEREPAMVVFGLPGTRRIAYRQISSLERTLKALGIREIFDAGMACGAPLEIAGIPLRHLGELPAEEVLALLSRVAFGYAATPPFCLGKSSVFAGYCAQGNHSRGGGILLRRVRWTEGWSPFGESADSIVCPGIRVWKPALDRRGTGTRAIDCACTRKCTQTGLVNGIERSG